MDRDEVIRRAAGAQQLLDNALLTELLDGLEAEATKAWRRSDAHDQAARETAYHDIAAVERLRKALRSLADDGKVAKTQIARETAQREAEKRGQA